MSENTKVNKLNAVITKAKPNNYKGEEDHLHSDGLLWNFDKNMTPTIEWKESKKE